MVTKETIYLTNYLIIDFLNTAHPKTFSRPNFIFHLRKIPFSHNLFTLFYSFLFYCTFNNTFGVFLFVKIGFKFDFYTKNLAPNIFSDEGTMTPADFSLKY